MAEYKVIVNGETTNVFFDEDQAIETIIGAHQRGAKWDVRKRTSGQGHRFLTSKETYELIAKVVERL